MKIGFIGAGKMAQALARGLINSVRKMGQSIRSNFSSIVDERYFEHHNLIDNCNDSIWILDFIRLFSLSLISS
ncbi:hypothetical protein DICVIV_06805 [Dictyocaulus viviparus]|uniref:Pyrroline-5-carboxylate reductase catalytic N-terminal domain-containing protein n=1 Tax=Dictyocaulus viviparus TaxID=29172 RepID=A0A0D8XTE8_DICVI|nr:hypothetical protein DICVIV_06805 [Dictyocaulus viviparus]